jgi:hypothetical protein
VDIDGIEVDWEVVVKIDSVGLDGFIDSVDVSVVVVGEGERGASRMTESSV